jgi:hypothetical protein
MILLHIISQQKLKICEETDEFFKKKKKKIQNS